MEILQCLLGALARWRRPRQAVRSHTKYQAYGRDWSRQRPRRIARYTRRRARTN